MSVPERSDWDWKALGIFIGAVFSAISIIVIIMAGVWREAAVYVSFIAGAAWAIAVLVLLVKILRRMPIQGKQ